MFSSPFRTPRLALGFSLCVAVAALPAHAAPLAGTVVETIDSGGYTYVQIKTGEASVWAAGPTTPLTKGAAITIDDGMPMVNFHSSSLDRTFDKLYFVNGFSGSTGAMPANPHGQAQAAPAIPLPNIARAEGGQTVAEIVAAKDSLAGKAVSVRGQVTKFNGGIMGKNWVHIRDSSANDLIVVTQGSAAVGDIVMVEGKVAVNRDFGYGYVYQLLIDEAKVSKE